jgi:SAM-dependent methyltransferase
VAESQVRASDRLMAFVKWSQHHFGKAISRYGYRVLTRRIGDQDVYFLNFGYEEDPPMGIPLDPSDEIDRYSIQLYHSTAAQVDLRGKDVLEVSCGHGGAASYITRTMHPASYTGLDYNPAGIEFCRRKHKLPGLSFVHGDAEKLPFPDNSFDAVINVEAAHLYPNYTVFLAEVARVLRPGGHFLYADLRALEDVEKWEADMAACSLRLVSDRAIDAEVLRGLQKNSRRHTELINRTMPAPLRRVGRDIGLVEGGRGYRQVERGELSYRIFLYTKD